MFLTVGAPHVELFHQGGGAEALRIYVTEGLVRRCQDDAQLAAVLCHELGKVACERQTLLRPAGRPAGDDRRAEGGVGNDAGGSFGPPDGTRLLEEGKKERQRRQKAATPTPDVLARRYLARADFPPKALTAVAPLLREAEQTYLVEKHLQPAEEPVRLLPAESAAQPVWRAGDQAGPR
jgi:predicted Zn-dependent protease